MPVAMGGAIVGWAGAKGYLASLPMIGGSRMTTLGILGYAALRWSKSKMLRSAGLAAVAAAAFDFGRVQGGGTRLLGDVIDGTDETAGDETAGDDY